ncbi:MAG: helix-turn-helix domain-containing protein [Candidatus Limnocylindrales bacterium]
MSTRERPVDAATRRARTALAVLGNEARLGRTEHGLSQADVGRAIGLSRSQVSRIERGLSPGVTVQTLARLHAAVGLDLSVRTYPGGQPLRDVARIALIRRLRAAVDPRWRWRFEVPLGLPGDRRAWDAVLARDQMQVAVEAETRVRDLQELERRVSLKQRDWAAGEVVLLLADTRSNRRIVRDFHDMLRAAFPRDGRIALEALRSGNAPGGNAAILL